MASKKGVIATGVILAVVTAASFLIWLVPQENDSTFVVSDYRGYLDGVKSIHEVLQESISIEQENLLSGTITPEEYVAITETTSSQVTAQISEFITSKPPEQWQTSYIEYMEAMKKFNTYIAETRVLAGMIENGESEEQVAQTVQRIESLRAESQGHMALSDGARP